MNNFVFIAYPLIQSSTLIVLIGYLMQELIERRLEIEKEEEGIRVGLEEVETKKSRMAIESESLSSMMEKMEAESMLLQDRLNALIQRENDFEAHKASWEVESSKKTKDKESLLEDMEITLETRKEMLDAQEAEFQVKIYSKYLLLKSMFVMILDM